MSQTLLLANMYQNPALMAPLGPDGRPQQFDARQAQEHFEVNSLLICQLYPEAVDVMSEHLCIAGLL